eukprot:s581_g37.t1
MPLAHNRACSSVIFLSHCADSFLPLCRPLVRLAKFANNVKVQRGSLPDFRAWFDEARVHREWDPTRLLAECAFVRFYDVAPRSFHIRKVHQPVKKADALTLTVKKVIDLKMNFATKMAVAILLLFLRSAELCCSTASVLLERVEKGRWQHSNAEDEIQEGRVRTGGCFAIHPREAGLDFDGAPHQGISEVLAARAEPAGDPCTAGLPDEDVVEVGIQAVGVSFAGGIANACRFTTGESRLTFFGVILVVETGQAPSVALLARVNEQNLMIGAGVAEANAGRMLVARRD